MSDWWKNTVVYQIYPQSFKDTNNDGIGDLMGVIEKIDYLKNLGIGAIWLTPIYSSPLIDNGYDIADYQNINPIYGDIEVFKKLVTVAKAAGIKIILDLVLNHTSDKHEWFIEAKKSKNNPYRDFYIWRDVPNSKKSSFGGPAWTFDETTNQYYFHQFAKEQPDLNWENETVRNKIAQMIKWWVDLGIGGFRLDVIDLIGKEVDKEIYTNGPNLHKFIQEMRAASWNTAEFLTVGECWGASIEDGVQYSNQESAELSMIFQFEHITKLQSPLGKYCFEPINFIKLKKVYEKWQTGLHNRGWNSLFLGNHDLPRMVSKYGNEDTYREASAKTLFTTFFLMQGTPFIYQGDEIGMTNTHWKNLSDYQDVEIKNKYNDLVNLDKQLTHEQFMTGLMINGRDHARTPMQWDSSNYAGFSTKEPWMKLNNNYNEINVATELKNENGILKFLQKLIKFRTKSEFTNLLIEGEYQAVDLEHPQLFIYTRLNEQTRIQVIANWSNDNAELNVTNISDANILLNTHNEFNNKQLQPWQTIVIKLGD